MEQKVWITLATYLAYCIDKELYKAIDYLGPWNGKIDEHAFSERLCRLHAYVSILTLYLLLTDSLFRNPLQAPKSLCHPGRSHDPAHCNTSQNQWAWQHEGHAWEYSPDKDR